MSMAITAFAPSAVARFLHFLHRHFARLGETPLVGRRTAADDVADAGEEIAEDVRADDGLAGDNAEITADGPAFDNTGRGHQHEHSPARFRVKFS